jgi:3-deoxy-D-manno-octulosonate 8-phosphate phosphatase KdsC-like HAD superfamily phosphatase
VTIRKSGQGCAREVIDLVRYAQGIHPENGDF